MPDPELEFAETIEEYLCVWCASGTDPDDPDAGGLMILPDPGDWRFVSVEVPD